MDNQTLLYETTMKIPEIFSEEHIELMLSTITHSKLYSKSGWGEWEKCRDKAILMTMYLLALRPKEACSLRFKDFNIERGEIRINGENNKQKKDRILPIPVKLLEYLKDYFVYDRTYFWRGSKYLFPSLQNDFISPGRWKYIMREKILKPCGLYEVNRTRSYTLRHSRATQLLNKTKDIFLVANILGHAKLDSTKVYLHSNPTYFNYMRESINNQKEVIL